MNESKYKRVLLKISGEALAGEGGEGFSADFVAGIADEIKDVLDMGLQIALVVGGGNILRGIDASAKGIDRVTADYMGMLATLINALAMQDALEKRGIPSRVMSSIPVEQVAETYIRGKAIRHLEKGRAVIFAAGTGNPYFTTDTAAALRAIEIGADLILKATKVDGIYDSDPVMNPAAKRFDQLTYLDILKRNLRAMDMTSISLCMDNALPIILFNLFEKGNIRRVICGEPIGTIVKEKIDER